MELWFVRVGLVGWGRSICKMIVEESGYLMAPRACGYESVMCDLWAGEDGGECGLANCWKACEMNIVKEQHEHKHNHVCYADSLYDRTTS